MSGDKRVDRSLLARFWRSASGYWRGRSAWAVWLLSALMLVIMVAQRRWDNVERGVKLALRCATEVVRLIIELRGVR